MVSPEYDSPFPGDNDIRRLAQAALDAVLTQSDPNRTPDEVGIDHVD